MSSINNVTRFIYIFGAALLLLILGLSPSFGEEMSTSEGDSSSSEEEEQALAGSSVILRKITLSLNYSFGIERTLDRGKEANRDVHYHFVSGELMYHVGNLGEEGNEHTRIELGLTIGGSPHGEYHGSEGPDANMDSGTNRYNSVFRNLRLGGKIVLRDIPHNNMPALWEASINPWVGYNYDRGRVGHNDPFAYRSKAVTYTIGVRAQAALLFPLYGTGTEVQMTRLRGEDATPVYNGFLPRIEVVGEYQNAFSTKRRTTVTRLGGSDRQRNVSYMAQIRVHLWRFNNETADIEKDWLFELDPVLIGHFEGATRYGFAQIRNDQFSNRTGGGFGLHLTINKTSYIQVEGIVKKAFDGFTLGRGSDEVIGQLGVNIGLSF